MVAFRFHVPGRERALDRISQCEDPFHLRIVFPDPIGRGFPIHVDRARFADRALPRLRLKIPVILFVIAVLLLAIEKVQLLARGRHANLRMLPQKGIQRRRPAFLRPANYKINAHLFRLIDCIARGKDAFRCLGVENEKSDDRIGHHSIIRIHFFVETAPIQMRSSWR